MNDHSVAAFKNPRVRVVVGGCCSRRCIGRSITFDAPPPDADRFHGSGWFASLNGATPIASFTTPWNVTGQPACSVPPPTWDGAAPVGVQLVGRSGDEATLLSLAAQLEAEIGWLDRRPPVD